MKVSNTERKQEKLHNILVAINESFTNYESLASSHINNGQHTKKDFEIQERKALAILKHNFNMLKDYKFHKGTLFLEFTNKTKLEVLYEKYLEDKTLNTLYGAKLFKEHNK